MNSRQYFASLPPEELAKELEGRENEYYEWLLSTHKIARWRIAFDTYYGQRGNHSSSFVTSHGDKGELSLLMSNEFRSLVQQIIVYTTKNKLAIECATINSDSESQMQAILGKQVLEAINRDQRVDQLAKQALEIAMIMDTSWMFTEFEFTRGEVKMLHPETGRVITKGESVCTVRTPLDVITDYTSDNPSFRDWQIKIDLVNKYDLAAQYPEMHDEIVGIERDKSKDSIYRFGDQGIYSHNTGTSPLILRKTFYHRKSPSMPMGRFFQYLNSKVILTKDVAPFQYDELPGTRVCPSEMIGSMMGYSNCNDLLALQDVVDAMMSSAVSNMTTFGLNNIWSKPNANLNYQQLTDGMGVVESEEKPEPLILNELSSQWMPVMNFVIQRMESLSGVNSIARGNTSGKDYSGAAMALLQSMAIEFNSGMQKSYNETLESVFNNILTNLQYYGDEEMEKLVAGSNKRYMVKKFRGKDVGKIKKVFIQESNAFQNTTAGKMAMVEYLMKFPNAIKYPDQIQQVLTTGNLDIVLEPQQKQNLAIQEENEALARGEQVQAVWTENHPAHLAQHACVTWDNDTKKNNPQALMAVDAHIQEHLSLWQSLPPDRLAVLGIPPYPMPMMMPTGAPVDPNAPGPMPPPTEAAGGPDLAPAQQPSLPTNPLTGQEFSPNGGLQ